MNFFSELDSWDEVDAEEKADISGILRGVIQCLVLIVQADSTLTGTCPVAFTKPQKSRYGGDGANHRLRPRVSQLLWMTLLRTALDLRNEPATAF